LDDRTILYFG
jgi:hypothetical protein